VREAGEVNPYGIDLNHHLIPDPVGRAISCLLERIEILEKKLASGHQTVNNGQECDDCEADNVCEPAAPALRRSATGTQ
jgi:serine O-acetyltransferase